MKHYPKNTTSPNTQRGGIMTNRFAHRLTHRCSDGSVAQLDGEWLEDAEEYQAYCESCESYVYGENGVEHV